MDAQGFLPISLIAGFHRVQALTMDINLIMEVRTPPSKVLPLRLFTLRRRHDTVFSRP